VVLAASAASVLRLLSPAGVDEVLGVLASPEAAAPGIARGRQAGACGRSERTGFSAAQPPALARSAE